MYYLVLIHYLLSRNNSDFFLDFMERIQLIKTLGNTRISVKTSVSVWLLREQCRVTWTCYRGGNDKNLIKFNEKCEVLNLGRGNLRHEYMLWENYLEITWQKRTYKLNVRQQYALAAKKDNYILDIRQNRSGEQILPLYSELGYCVKSGSLTRRQNWTYWKESNGGPTRWPRGWNISLMKRLRARTI